jgi:histidinol-phosphate aminotransferase
MVQVSSPTLLEDAYTPGLPREYVHQKFGIPLDDIAKLGSAENPFGASPMAMRAAEWATSRLDLYPEWTGRNLREAIARKYGVHPDAVVCGAGETEIISSILRAFAKPGEPVLMYEPCFPIYHMYAENEGRLPVYVPLGPQFDFAIDRYVEALRNRPRIAFITNPHNPTGKLMAQNDIRRICEAAAESGTLLVLDEAYIHYSETSGGLHLTKDYPNLIVLRTFSKAFGLAGLRVGFGVGQSAQTVKPLWNIKPTWNMGQAQVAGGIAALADDEHVEKTVKAIVEMRAYVTNKLDGLNSFRMVPGSRSNFFLLEIVDPKLTSTRVFEELLKRGVIVKDGSVSFRGLRDRYLRSDVSLRRHMDRLAWALGEVAADVPRS